MIRITQPTDFQDIYRIWQAHYGHEFLLPNFEDRNEFLCSFAAVNDANVPVTFAGLRKIIEIIAITDKTFPPNERAAKLAEILSASKYVTNQQGFDQIHAFIQDKNWERRLLRSGFFPCKGTALVMNV